MQKHVPPRRTGALVWLVWLGATGGCQLLFGVDLPDQDGGGTGAGGGTAGVPVGGSGGAPAMGGAGTGGTGGTGVASGQGGGAGQSGAGAGGGAGGMPGQGGAGGQGGVGGQTGEEPIASHIAAGWHHFCVWVSGGKVRCWGHNSTGQLGDGTTTERLTPVPVLASPGGQPLTGVQALALGSYNSCALLSGGEVRCWGWNYYGALGNGTTTDPGQANPTPAPVSQSLGGPPLTSVQALKAGGSHNCAHRTSGEVYCWGLSSNGQLGFANNPPDTQPTPVPVVQAQGGPPLTGIQTLTLGGGHSCALLSGGRAQCWGYNENGAVGSGQLGGQLNFPVPVLQSPGGAPLTGAQALSLGVDHSCALVGGGQVNCWGSNEYGQLGAGTTDNQSTPVPVLQSPGGLPLAGVQQVALGYFHSCALLSGGDVRCWGDNAYGQLGDGTEVDRHTPVPVLQSLGGPHLTGVQALALGRLASCALLIDGEVRCWGDDNGPLPKPILMATEP